MGPLITYYLKEARPGGPDPDDDVAGRPDGSGERMDNPGAGAEDHADDDGAESEPEPPTVEILDGSGQVIRTLKDLPAEAGMNRVNWDLGEDPPFTRTPGPPISREFFGAPRGANVLPGTYTVRLTVDDQTLETVVQVRVDPTVDVSPADLQRQYLA